MPARCRAVPVGGNPVTGAAGAKAAGVDFIHIGEGDGARSCDPAELGASQAWRVRMVDGGLKIRASTLITHITLI